MKPADRELEAQATERPKLNNAWHGHGNVLRVGRFT